MVVAVAPFGSREMMQIPLNIKPEGGTMKGLQARLERLEIDVTHNETKIADVDTLAVDHAGERDVMPPVRMRRYPAGRGRK